MQGYHKPVLLREVMDLLGVKAGKWYLDGTLGDGGHSLEVMNLGGNILGIDVDPSAIERVKERFEKLGIDKSRYLLIQGNFRDVKNLTQTDADQKFAGAIFDLGVSSLQLESPERGFSFSKDGPLDMRMDPILGVKALDLINVLSRKELYELFKSLGEEKYSKRLADTLVRTREIGISTTKELAKLVEGAIGRREKINPATRVFQALRIAVNDELGALQEGLEQIKDLIEKGGVILVISFHSLEDRIVKNAFRTWQENGIGQVLTKKPMIPTEMEVIENPRSRSAKMRAFKKT